MLITVVAIFDQAASMFHRPAFVPTRGVGVRQFTDEVNRSQDGNQIYMHPQDFSLHVLGEFDDATGEFKCHRPELICRASDVRQEV